MKRERSVFAEQVFAAIEAGHVTQDEIGHHTKLTDARIGRGIAELLLDEGAIGSEVITEEFEAVRKYFIVIKREEKETRHAA